MARYRRFDTARAGHCHGARGHGGCAPAPRRGSVRDERARTMRWPRPRPDVSTSGGSGVRESLTSLHEVWTRHIVETEAPGAFLDELVGESPRLSTPAARLRREHNEILGGDLPCGEVAPPGVARRRSRTLRRRVARRSHHDALLARASPPARRRSHLRRLRRRHRRRLSGRRLTRRRLRRALRPGGVWSRCARRSGARAGSVCAPRGNGRPR